PLHDALPIYLLKRNQVQMSRFKKDTTLLVTSYKLGEFETRKNAYEGHYQHYNTHINTSKEKINFRKGDYYLETNQMALRYILETLEPQAPDSFFNWKDRKSTRLNSSHVKISYAV